MECTIFSAVIETDYNFLNKKNLKLYTIVIVQWMKNYHMHRHIQLISYPYIALQLILLHKSKYIWI